MPNRETHFGIALLIFGVYAFILYKFFSLNYIYYSISVFVGAILPDILDPWSKENRYEHRRFFHSTNLLKPLWVVCGISLILSFLFPKFIILLFFVLGYLSHLLADSVKSYSWSKGLPTYAFVSGKFVKKG